MANENPQESEPSLEWAAQYEFWTRIIGDEVARLRFNEGFEPIDVHLYEVKRGSYSRFIGQTKICGRDFECTVVPWHDAEGRATLKLSICVSPRKHH